MLRTNDPIIVPLVPQRVGPTVRLLREPAGADLRAHHEAWGALPQGVDLSNELHRSGLTGRGGAAFPAARKMAALEAAPRMILGNASEGEPLSMKDSALLRDSPHLVFDGMRALGDALAPAAPLVLAVHPRNLAAAEGALAARPDRARFQLRAQRDAFVAGEASAVLSRVRGGRGLPADHRYRMTSSAHKGGPALLFNVETLAHIALIARFGGAWFREVGSEADPGTRLFTVATEAGPRHVLELPGGSTLRDALLASSLDPDITTAVLVGGYHGEWVGPRAMDRPLAVGRDAASLAAGAGVLLVLQGTACPLHVTDEIVAYLAAKSARQCGPCTLGLPRLSAQVQALARGALGAVERIEQQADLIAGRGACHHPDGTVRLVRSAVREFAAESTAHAAGVCHLNGMS